VTDTLAPERVQDVLDRLDLVSPASKNTRQLWLHIHRADILRLINLVGAEEAADLLGMYRSVVNRWLSTVEPDPDGVWPTC
jgi:hypothetical protein